MLSRQCNLPCLRVCHIFIIQYVKNIIHVNRIAILIENSAQFSLLFSHAICTCTLPSALLNWSYTLRTAHQLLNVSYRHIVKSMKHTALTNNPCQNPILIISLYTAVNGVSFQYTLVPYIALQRLLLLFFTLYDYVIYRTVTPIHFVSTYFNYKASLSSCFTMLTLSILLFTALCNA